MAFRYYLVLDEDENKLATFENGLEDELIDFIKTTPEAVYLDIKEQNSQETGFSKTPKYSYHLFWERDIDPIEKLDNLTESYKLSEKDAGKLIVFLNGVAAVPSVGPSYDSVNQVDFSDSSDREQQDLESFIDEFNNKYSKKAERINIKGMEAIGVNDYLYENDEDDLDEKLVMQDPRDRRKKVVVPEGIEEVINSPEFQRIKDICKEYYNGKGIEKVYKPEERNFVYHFTFDGKYGSIKKDFLAEFYKRFGFNDLEKLATHKNGWGHSEYEGFLTIGGCNVRIDATTGFRIYSINIMDDKTEIMEDLDYRFIRDLCSKLNLNRYEASMLVHDINNLRGEEWLDQVKSLNDNNILLNFKKIAQIEDLEEDIEKHDTLNPKLFDGEELKPEVKETIENVVDLFIQELEEEGVRFDLKDILLIGSNVNYNYTKDSDLDVHIIADSTHLDCPHNLYPLLYSAFRSMFNKNYDIRIKGIPLELYVEMDEPGGKSNGVYSLKTGWVKRPVQKDIPDLDHEAFDKLFKEWEDKYFDLIGGQEILTEGPQDSRRYFVKPYNKYCASKEEILDILVHSGEKDCTIYTLKNLGDAKDISHLGPRDVIYYYKDGKLYDKNGVKVMDYNLIIKNEENRKKFVDVHKLPDEIFDKVYADRLTEFLKEDDVLTEDKSDDIYKFIEDLYNLRKESIAKEGEYGLGNLVFKEFRNLGYLDNLKELRKVEKSKELSLEKLDEDINNVETRLDTLIKELSEAGIDWEMESLWDDEPYTDCVTILDGQEEKADDIICSIYGDCYVWVRDQDGNRRYCKIIGD